MDLPGGGPQESAPLLKSGRDSINTTEEQLGASSGDANHITFDGISLTVTTRTGGFSSLKSRNAGFACGTRPFSDLLPACA